MADENQQKPKMFSRQISLGDILFIISLCFTVIGAAWYLGSTVVTFAVSTDKRLTVAEYQMKSVQTTLASINRKLDGLPGIREGKRNDDNGEGYADDQN